MNHKGVSQAMWIIIALVVALIVALAVITVFSNSSGNVDKSNKGIIDNTRSAIEAQICGSMCDTCKQNYGTSCDWNTYRNGKCASFTNC